MTTEERPLCDVCGEYRDECTCGVEAAWKVFFADWQTTEMIRPAEAFAAFAAGFNHRRLSPASRAVINYYNPVRDEASEMTGHIVAMEDADKALEMSDQPV